MNGKLGSPKDSKMRVRLRLLAIMPMQKQRKFWTRRALKQPRSVRTRLSRLKKLPQQPAKRRLQQDGAKVHWTKENREYIKRVLKLPLLDEWPAHSPDLSPIENMWSIVQRAVSQRGPWAVEELQKYVQEEWAKVPESVVDSLVLSFKSRCERCVAAEGSHVDA